MSRRAKSTEYIEIASLDVGLAEGQLPGKVVQPLRHLLARLAGREQLPKRLALVATLRQEGVSYITLALAATLAHDLTANVCAVELNWWWPSLAARLGRPGPGLAEVLAGQSLLDEALLATRCPNLVLLPAGALPLEQRPVVANSEALRQTIEQLAARFDYLLLDIPALMATSDAIPLAALSEACCLVVRQGATPTESVRRALDDIEHLPVLGVLLNQACVATPRWLFRLASSE